MATISSIKRRIKKLEKAAQQRKKAMSRSAEECVCFPEGHAPTIQCAMKRNIAFSVKCPLHGDRFPWDPGYQVFQAKYREITTWHQVLAGRWLTGWTGPRHIPAQFCKAFLAGFPADLWSVDEEKDWDGDVCKTYVRLQNGTRVQVEQCRLVEEVRNNHQFAEPGFSSRPTMVLKSEPGAWQMETIQIMARLLSARGRIVDPRLLCGPTEEDSAETKE